MACLFILVFSVNSIAKSGEETSAYSIYSKRILIRALSCCKVVSYKSRSTSNQLADLLKGRRDAQCEWRGKNFVEVKIVQEVRGYSAYKRKGGKSHKG